jgi:ribosomal protein S18 acetylase RimI-like enzyme
MITLERLSSENVEAFRTVRLAALKDTPSAFGSIYAKESKLTDEDWGQKVSHWSSDRSTAYIAMESGKACGIAGGFVSDDDATAVSLISMWVSPTHRKQGVGRTLVSSIGDWATRKNARTLQLLVTNNNEAAIKFYQRLGFELTGNTEPYPNDTALLELEMVRSL